MADKQEYETLEVRGANLVNQAYLDKLRTEGWQVSEVSRVSGDAWALYRRPKQRGK